MNKWKLLLLGIFCLFLACLSTNYDYDLFARLIVGERFVEQGILPFQDFLSYTPTHPWYDHEWGSGVLFYIVLKYLGNFGIVLLQAVLMFFTSFFVIKTQKLQRHSYPVLLIFMTIFLALFFKMNSSLIRCQLFSFMFFGMFLYILEKHRKQGSKLIWLIPPLTVIWNNLHGGVVSGLGLVFMYFIGSLFEKKDWKKYLSVLLVSIPLLIINPYGYKYLNFLFSAATMHRKYITEWWNILSGNHLKNYFLPVFFVISGLALSFRKRKFDITKTIVLAVTLYMGLMHIKLLSLSLIAAGALCGNDILRIFRGKILRRVEKSLCPVIILCALLIPLYSPAVPRADFSKFPLKEVEFLKINNIKGNIVTPFAFGSYVSYKLYPGNLIYMDGRYEEVYNDKEFLTLRDYELAENNWQDIVNNYPTEILMPLKTVDIYKILKNDTGWVEIYTGPLCGIFVKQNYKISQNMLAPSDDINYYREGMFKTSINKTAEDKWSH